MNSIYKTLRNKRKLNYFLHHLGNGNIKGKLQSGRKYLKILIQNTQITKGKIDMLIYNWLKTLNRHYTNENIHMDNKYIQKCLI